MIGSWFLNHTLLMLVMINREGCYNPEFDSVDSSIDSGCSLFPSDMVAISALSAPSMHPPPPPPASGGAVVVVVVGVEVN